MSDRSIQGHSDAVAAYRLRKAIKRRGAIVRVKPGGKIAVGGPKRVGLSFEERLAQKLGLSLPAAPQTAALPEETEILAHVEAWAGGPEAARKWYRAQPIPALGNRTAEAMVKDGEAERVREYLDHLSQGGFA